MPAGRSHHNTKFQRGRGRGGKERGCELGRLKCGRCARRCRQIGKRAVLSAGNDDIGRTKLINMHDLAEDHGLRPRR